VKFDIADTMPRLQILGVDSRSVGRSKTDDTAYRNMHHNRHCDGQRPIRRGLCLSEDRYCIGMFHDRIDAPMQAARVKALSTSTVKSANRGLRKEINERPDLLLPCNFIVTLATLLVIDKYAPKCQGYTKCSKTITSYKFRA